MTREEFNKICAEVDMLRSSISGIAKGFVSIYKAGQLPNKANWDFLVEAVEKLEVEQDKIEKYLNCKYGEKARKDNE